MPTDISFYCKASVAPEKQEGNVCVCVRMYVFGWEEGFRKGREGRTERKSATGRMRKSLKEP